jgi:hypothetical protein
VRPLGRASSPETRNRNQLRRSAHHNHRLAPPVPRDALRSPADP